MTIVDRVLRSMPIIDGHNDLPSRLRALTGYDVGGLADACRQFHTDLPRLRAGGVGAQFWSAYVPSDLPESEAVVATMEQIDAIYRMATAYPDDLAMAFTAADVEHAMAAGRIASLIGVEGGHSLATSLGVLRSFARLGVRYVTLTHNHHTSWADSAALPPIVGGLNPTGRAVVAELQRVGVLVDLSHVAQETMHAALDIATAPVIFSHSSARAVTDHPRNVPNDVLTRLAANGGVVQLTFVPAFLSDEAYAWARAEDAERERLAIPVPPWPRAPRPGEDPRAVPRQPSGDDDRMRPWLRRNPRPDVTVAQVADHVEHARAVAGVEHIGLGGDYDGVDVQPTGLADVAGYPHLLQELVDRGWSANDLEQLTGRNMLRVLRDAEAAADEPLWPRG